ncbi:MAG: LysR family transcriptional regulator [Alphaproteobacteria bacterium]|nr:LysR family transcriptional regulator [Alphaproteobacteria bacterium]
MNLRDLRYITALARLGHFGRAAEACHISQPTLSGQILKLEEELGIAIFERVGRSVRVTAAGEQIIEQAQRAVQAADDILASARAARDPLRGPLSIGAIPTIAPYLLPHVLPKAGKDMPNAPLILYEDITQNLMSALTAGQLDAAIIATQETSPLITQLPLYDEPFWVVLPQEHKLAARKTIAPQDLDPRALLLLADGHCLRDQALDLCGHPELGDGHLAEVRALSLETLMQLAAAGYGVTLAPELVVQSVRGLAQGLVARKLSGKQSYRRICLAFRRNSPRLKALETLAQIIRSTIKKSPNPIDRSKDKTKD